MNFSTGIEFSKPEILNIFTQDNSLSVIVNVDNKDEAYPRRLLQGAEVILFDFKCIRITVTNLATANVNNTYLNTYHEEYDI